MLPFINRPYFDDHHMLCNTMFNEPHMTTKEQIILLHGKQALTSRDYDIYLVIVLIIVGILILSMVSTWRL